MIPAVLSALFFSLRNAFVLRAANEVEFIQHNTTSSLQLVFSIFTLSEQNIRTMARLLDNDYANVRGIYDNTCQHLQLDEFERIVGYALQMNTKSQQLLASPHCINNLVFAEDVRESLLLRGMPSAIPLNYSEMDPKHWPTMIPYMIHWHYAVPLRFLTKEFLASLDLPKLMSRDSLVKNYNYRSILFPALTDQVSTASLHSLTILVSRFQDTDFPTLRNIICAKNSAHVLEQVHSQVLRCSQETCLELDTLMEVALMESPLDARLALLRIWLARSGIITIIDCLRRMDISCLGASSPALEEFITNPLFIALELAQKQTLLALVGINYDRLLLSISPTIANEPKENVRQQSTHWKMTYFRKWYMTLPLKQQTGPFVVRRYILGQKREQRLQDQLQLQIRNPDMFYTQSLVDGTILFRPRIWRSAMSRPALNQLVYVILRFDKPRILLDKEYCNFIQGSETTGIFENDVRYLRTKEHLMHNVIPPDSSLAASRECADHFRYIHVGWSMPTVMTVSELCMALSNR
ncbi:hypothetical protein PSACC_01077 [Paramicrosporidium saccamoebae]|uniref:Uncharacterized protein n=1 Tax=Paramicrosporidium saccamoebae TaxID=1246581 RepID=A0A2H9TMX4_9FUNG|nr:hypothetical protein PSACC_01077 [Paramicrosporidium saccamoebae]